MLAAADLLVYSAAAFAFAAAVTASGGTGVDLDGADCNLTVGVVTVKPGGGGFTRAGTPSRVAVGGAAFGSAGNIKGSSLSGIMVLLSVWLLCSHLLLCEMASN